MTGLFKTTSLAGIYIHIPFCKKACSYCNFHFSTNLNNKASVINAIAKEIRSAGDFIEAQTIETIYFGGGTPGILSIDELKQLLSAINERFAVVADAEITLEANPDDINPGSLNDWLQLGVNRLSLGIQTFDDELLRKMNRAHDATKARDALAQIKTAGFTNFSADLIYGSAGQTAAGLDNDLDILFEHDVPHLSCYALTVEERTALAHSIASGKSIPPDADVQAALYELLIHRTSAAGYEAYEISNIAKPGFRSRHNSNYWRGVPYYGFGPSAHGYDGKYRRRKNIANNALYQTAIKEGLVYHEDELLTENDRFNEFVMISLRMSEGLDLHRLQTEFPTQRNLLLSNAEKFETEGLVKTANGYLRLTKKGSYLADGIAAALFVLD